jgi:hypothetical protein
MAREPFRQIKLDVQGVDAQFLWVNVARRTDTCAD